MTRDVVIELCGVDTVFSGHYVHRKLDLSIERGQIVGLLGGSGSGKTTLLREMLGLLRPTAGYVRLFDVDLNDPDSLVQRAIRRRLGMLFQHGALFSALSVFDNIAFPLRELRCLDEDWIRHLVHLKLAMVELAPAHGLLMPAELSGGMVKRVALARALALEPELLLLDEPTAGLDPDRSQNFVELVGSLQQALGLTVVMVTHDLNTLAGLASHVAVLAEGHIIAHGPKAEVMTVDHPFVTGFFGADRKKLL
ncbi:ATP-binding cassette domain-containing protein [Dechloromonas denitrificans]|uniref:ABC transporter ATP-binding protein n=1 Tax=Dechloromonas denitrificans TaxID=281362 RepID=UPI001CF87619|nr:ATP-binding cassette domain-containing protein [Dechloromonas denitrificans]UCV10625.1 ATP-binding cassette domain-containing protein [Dechloromonas denitrificans]